MKLTVLNWLGNFLLSVTARIIESAFRIILFFIPLGVFMTILQCRKNVSKVSNLSAFTNENSVWQHVFPGFMLVSTDPKEFQTIILKIKNNFQLWINSNKYILAFVFMSLIVILMIVN